MINPTENHNFKNPKIIELAFITNVFFDNLHRYHDNNLPDVNYIESYESYSYKHFIADNPMYVRTEDIICFDEFSRLEKKPIKFLENIGFDSNPEIKKILKEIKIIKNYILKIGVYSPVSRFNSLESAMIDKIINLDKKIEEIKRERKLTHTKKVKYML